MKNFSIFSISLLALSLTGCGKEPPSCNDPNIMAKVSSILGDSYTKNIKVLGLTVQDITQIKLDTPTVIGYDKEIKSRQCSVTAVLTPNKTKLAQVENYLKVAKLHAQLFGAFAPMKLSFESDDVLALLNSDPAETLPTDGELKVPLTYTIQLQEQADSYALNVRTLLRMPLLKVMALADVWTKKDAAKQIEMQQIADKARAEQPDAYNLMFGKQTTGTSATTSQ